MSKSSSRHIAYVLGTLLGVLLFFGALSLYKLLTR